jgi:hypothetical protein
MSGGGERYHSVRTLEYVFHAAGLPGLERATIPGPGVSRGRATDTGQRRGRPNPYLDGWRSMDTSRSPEKEMSTMRTCTPSKPSVGLCLSWGTWIRSTR